MSCPISTMNYQQVHQALDKQFRCLEEKYRRTMEEHLRAIEKKHCLEMKQDQLLRACHSQNKDTQDRSEEDQDLKCRETQEQEQIMTDQYREYRKNQYMAMEEEYKCLKQKQGQALEEQRKQNRELGDQALKEKYCLYKQLRERCSEEQFKGDLEKLRCIKEGLCQEGKMVKSRSRPEQLQYRIETQDPCLLFKRKTQDTPCQHRKEPHAPPCWCQRQSVDTETPLRAEGHLGYYADDESSCESRAPDSDATKKSCLKTCPSLSSISTFQKVAPNTPRSSINTLKSSVCAHQLHGSTAGSSFNVSRPSVCSSEASDIQSPNKCSNWFTSFIIDQMPHIYQKLRSSDMPQMCDEHHLKEFIVFLQDQNILDSLQDEAEKAVSGLVHGSMSRDMAMSRIDTAKDSSCLGKSSQLCSRTSRSTYSKPQGISSFSANSGICGSHSCSAVNSLDMEVIRSSSSIDGSLCSQEDKPPEGFWEEAPLQDSTLPTCRKADLPPWHAKSRLTVSDVSCDSAQKSCMSSSEKSEMTWGSYNMPELLFIGSVSSTTNDQTEMSSSSSSVATNCTNIGRTHPVIPDRHICSTSGRYTQFLDFLDDKKVFCTLQGVVDKAINLLLKTNGKEKISSMVTVDSTDLPVSDPKVISVNSIEVPITQIYNAELRPPESGQKVPEVAGPVTPQPPGPNPPQLPLQESTQISEAQSPAQIPQPQPMSQITDPALPDPETASTRSSQPSAVTTEPQQSANETSAFMSPTPTTLSTTTAEMEQTSTAKSIKTSTVRTKPSGSSRVTSTSKTKQSTSKTKDKARQKKLSNPSVQKSKSSGLKVAVSQNERSKKG
ncbi:uncharacterized protein LOC144792711 isoform X2 [Lissotriton helveticus]